MEYEEEEMSHFKICFTSIHTIPDTYKLNCLIPISSTPVKNKVYSNSEDSKVN